MYGILANCILDEPIVLNDDDEESESTKSEAGEVDDEVGSIGELDATPRDLTSGLVGDGLDPATQLLFDLTAVHNSNNGAADDKCPLPNVGSASDFDAPPPRDPASELMDDGFDLATQLLLFNPTAVYNSNDSITGGKCPFPNKRERSPSSCGDPTVDLMVLTSEKMVMSLI